MSYKIYLFDALDSLGWSQAAWKVEGPGVVTDDCQGELVHDVMLANLPVDGLIVDAGCGVARWPIYLRQKGYRAFGLEYSHDACVKALETDEGLDLVRADVRKPPLKAGSVDAVLSLGVVEHDEAGPTVALREAYRILRPGGRLLVAVPFNNLARRLLFNRLLSAVTWQRRRANWGLGFAEYRFTRREMESFLTGCGFEILAAHPNDLRPPKNMGLWVDYNNLVLNPFQQTSPAELFRPRGAAAKVANFLIKRVPWLVAGEILLIARKPLEGT